ncbi:MAG: AAA family ATPase [Phycisphaerales bacterium]
MKLVEFQIEMYKSIVDSGWVKVNDLTVLVGKNEVGKTSLLRGLHKFNPFHADPYDLAREWPRGKRDQKSDQQIVCRTRFKIDQENAELSEITGKPINLDILEITKNYAGEFEVYFPEELFPDRLHPNDIDKAMEKLPKLPEAVSPPFAMEAGALAEETRRLAAEGRFTELIKLPDAASPRLTGVRIDANTQPQYQNETQYIEQLSASLRTIVQELQKTETVQHKAHDYVVSCIPTFVYMDEYKSFRGTAMLNEVQQRRKKPAPDDEALLTILSLSGLSLDELVKKGNDADKEERQYDLSDGASTLTEKIRGHWGQLKYDVHFNADGQQFFTFIRDPKDKALIKLEERSRGFQWFFSFDLLLMHQTKGTFEGCVILLDEPGLHLHPEGQQDLLKRLAEYAKGNVLIYSTHLPFMIDLQEPDRIRILSETPNGMIVTDDLTQTQPEGKLTLQAALGISGRTSYLVADRNLVVEGVDDYWIITALSALAGRSTKQTLPDDVLITPAGGASEVTYIATFMVGQELGVVALYDTDESGTTAKDKFVKKWLTRYHDRPAGALALGEVWKLSGEASIEDLFPDDFYLGYVKKLYNKQLAAAGVSDIAIKPGGQLVKRVEAFFEANKLTFNKGSLAKRIAADIRAMKQWGDLPTQTQDRGQSLIKEIAAAADKLQASSEGKAKL